MYEPAGRSAARAAIVAHSVSSHAKPCDRALGRRAIRVEAAAGVAMAGRPDGIDRDQQRVAVAVDRPVDEPQDVAAGLALAPEAVAGPGMEVDVAGRRRRGQRLGIHVADHQDPAVGDVLDHGRDEAVRPEAHVAVAVIRPAPASAAPAGRPPPSPP